MDRKILFLCTGNSARSQMGEALLRKHAGDIFQVFSAGAVPKEEIFPPVVAVMREIGIDLSGVKPKGVEDYLGKVHFEKVIIVCAEADRQCPNIFASSQRLSWPFEDPAKASGTEADILAFCRDIRDQIENKIQSWLMEERIKPQCGGETGVGP